MKGALEQRPDGSVALFINGDLQFDSTDERIYHESLALPALSLCLARKQKELRVLVIGGGDGLTARELFKSSQVTRVDLVDYDAQIVALAQGELSRFNENSLSNPRLQLYVQDAWAFVDEAVSGARKYDLVVCDLTVPEDIDGARFHTCDWYGKLHRLLEPEGVVAVNACSPDATPRAFCSIFNSLLKAEFDARPLHVKLPSFTARGYGDDWGFFIASPRVITASELAETFESLKPRHWLSDLTMLLQLFEFPQELFEHQSSALPSAVGSDILLSYFYNDKKLVASSGLSLNSLNLDLSAFMVPEADTGKTLLPAYVGQALVQSLRSQIDAPCGEDSGFEQIHNEVMTLIPALYRDHTPRVVGEFLNDPAAFLKGLDLRALVNALLQRAHELPPQLVAELEVLRERLTTWMDDNLEALSLGHRVLSILTLVVVLGNLLYPDMVYAKGDHHAAAAHGAVGHRGGRGYSRGWGGGTYYYGRNYVAPVRSGPIGPANSPPSKGVQIRNYAPSKKSLPDQSSLPEPGVSISKTTSNKNEREISVASQDLERLHRRLQSKQNELREYASVLRRELLAYQSSTDALVVFGTHEIPVQEAIRRTNLALATTEAEARKVHDSAELLIARLEAANSQTPTNDEMEKA